MNKHIQGYLSNQYAKSLNEFGEPIYMKHCGGWILKRRIPGSDYYDAMSLYPLFCCKRWENIQRDIDEISDSIVSLTLITNPFIDTKANEDVFSEKMATFKPHYVLDLTPKLSDSFSSHHSYYVRRSLKDISVEIVRDKTSFVEKWIRLYQYLVDRHNITGIQAFSERSFRQQMKVPGLYCFQAKNDLGDVVGAELWFKQGDRVYSHLSAYNAEGYDLSASYAIHGKALEYFKELGARWVDLGGGAGIDTDGTDGLSKFKKGWVNTEKDVHLCGVILNRGVYSKLSEDVGLTDYFPKYRYGEFD